MLNAHVDAADELIQTAVAALLRRVPERWEEYDADLLTATEAKSLFLLVAAGMVERRIHLRIRLNNHPVAVEATVTATGEYGFAEAMEPVLGAMWTDWKEAFAAWRSGETRGSPSTVTEHLKPDEWRLTDQGLLARTDLDNGDAQVALDFVLRRGFFDGNPRLILESGAPRISQREPVAGCGRLVTMRKVQADGLPPATVNVGNWAEAANAFDAVLQKIMRNGGPPLGNGNGRAETEAGDDDETDDSPTATGATQSWDERVAEYLAAHQKDLDEMRDAYLVGNRELGNRIWGQYFTPTIISRALTKKNTHRGSVCRTNAYRHGVQRYHNGKRWSDANI